MPTVKYDYVIVGAGAAGSVLANRLSADPKTRVLLLEAGGKGASPLLKIPAGFGKVMGTSVNWLFDTAPQKNMLNRKMFLPQGKALGGSTAVNAMLYVRGNKGDYDQWEAQGNKGWGYQDVLPYYKVHERNERIADEFHGISGELNVADQVEHNPLSQAFVRASQQAGIPFNPDPNGACQTGVFYHQVTQRKALRESAATAFLKPIKKRPNLVIQTGGDVQRVLFEGKRATGVEFKIKGRTEQVLATKEVIVSAGAINSPRLLLLSGVGPANELSELGIPVVHDLPGVGKNLHDQLEVYLTAQAKDNISYTGEDRALRALGHGIQYVLYRTGPATATVTQAGAFLHSSLNEEQPDIQLHMLPVYVLWEDGKHQAEKATGHGFTILACAIRPKSRGAVTLVSADPSVPPVVDPNYLDHPDDMRVTIDGFKEMRKILDTPAFSEYSTGENFPGNAVVSDEQIAQHIKETAKTDYHPVGSCKMGTDPLAVVDPQLRVHGIENLRVIDSSIMPSIISGNTQAPSMMIGEKGAAIILGTDSSVLGVIQK